MGFRGFCRANPTNRAFGGRFGAQNVDSGAHSAAPGRSGTMNGPMRCLLIVCCLALGAAFAGELLEPEKSSPRARRMRDQAFEKLDLLAETLAAVKAKADVAPEAALAAMEPIEEAVKILERSLAVEWNADANRRLAEAARAWYYLRHRLPAPEEPADEEARKKRDAAAERAHREHLRDARRFLLDVLKARKYEKQFRRCPRCDGRKELRGPFSNNKPLPCPNCAQTGVLRNEKGILEATWLCYSPLYRADSRNLTSTDRKLLRSQTRPETLAPFVRTASIEGRIEDHDLWVRIHTKEKVYTKPGARKTETVENSYALFRVGDVWYFHTPRFDGDLVEVPEEPKPDESK